MKANHKYLQDFNPDEESKYLIDWDFNSLYPSVMVEELPVRDFRWATEDEIEIIFKLYKDGKFDDGVSHPQGGPMNALTPLLEGAPFIAKLAYRFWSPIHRESPCVAALPYNRDS